MTSRKEKRKETYTNIFYSDIFNRKPPKSSVPKIRVRVSQPCLEKTENDVFNIVKNGTQDLTNRSQTPTHKILRRRNDYNKIYGSDIFCQTEIIPSRKREGVKKIRNANNYSNFDYMQNNEEYSKNMKKYIQEKRAEKKDYPIELYVNKEAAPER